MVVLTETVDRNIFGAVEIGAAAVDDLPEKVALPHGSGVVALFVDDRDLCVTAGAHLFDALPQGIAHRQICNAAFRVQKK